MLKEMKYLRGGKKPSPHPRISNGPPLRNERAGGPDFPQAVWIQLYRIPVSAVMIEQEQQN